MDRVLLDTNLPRLQEKDCLWHQVLLVHVDLELPDAVVLLYRIGAIPIKALTTKNSAGLIYVTLACILLSQFVLYPLMKRTAKYWKPLNDVPPVPMIPDVISAAWSPRKMPMKASMGIHHNKCQHFCRLTPYYF